MSDQLSPDAKAIVAAMAAAGGDGGLSSKEQSSLWKTIGMAAVATVFVGGFGLVTSQIGETQVIAEKNGNQLSDLTIQITKLVEVTEQQQLELGKRGNWMAGVDTYSEKSRLADELHSRQLDLIEQKLDELESR